jgi:NADH pyrophosphatase NudC (nudix superfamily)
MTKKKETSENNKAMQYEPVLSVVICKWCDKPIQDKNEQMAENGNALLKLNGDGDFCFSCKKNEMFLSDNELVYECRNCRHWEYSSS